MAVEAPAAPETATSNNAIDQSQSPSGDQGSNQPESVSIAASQGRFAGLAARFFGRPVHVEGTSESESGKDEGEDGTPGAGDQPKPEPEKVTLTKEELARMVQSEADRKIARQNKAAQDQAEAARLEKLKREDPYSYIEQQEQAKASGEFIANIAKHYDEAFLDPLKDRLSEKDRQALLGKDGVAGIEGRKQFVGKALDILLKEAEAKGAKAAEKRLRANPAAMKQVLIGEREQSDEPDVTEGSGVPASSKVDMNLLIRRAAGR